MTVYGALNRKTEFILLFLYNIFAILAHLHYAICVVGITIRTLLVDPLVVCLFQVQQICDHLGIFAFKITDRSNAAPSGVDVHMKHR